MYKGRRSETENFKVEKKMDILSQTQSLKGKVFKVIKVISINFKKSIRKMTKPLKNDDSTNLLQRKSNFQLNLLGFL
jgi:hypothetical protein